MIRKRKVTNFGEFLNIQFQSYRGVQILEVEYNVNHAIGSIPLPKNVSNFSDRPKACKISQYMEDQKKLDQTHN